MSPTHPILAHLFIYIIYYGWVCLRGIICFKLQIIYVEPFEHHPLDIRFSITESLPYIRLYTQ